MEKDVNPEFRKDAFNCPLCGAYAKQQWSGADGYDMMTSAHGHKVMPTGRIADLAFSRCERCKRNAVWTTSKRIMVYPDKPARTFDTTEVPKEHASDYDEACAVIHLSPKASAALSRRCLQAILREQGFSARTLSDEIQLALDSGKLPGHIADNLDAVRNVGNFAAHSLKDTNSGEVLEVEVGEAEWNLEVLEALFDFFYIQPMKAKERRGALNEKLKAAGKPEMK